MTHQTVELSEEERQAITGVLRELVDIAYYGKRLMPKTIERAKIALYMLESKDTVSKESVEKEGSMNDDISKG